MTPPLQYIAEQVRGMQEQLGHIRDDQRSAAVIAATLATQVAQIRREVDAIHEGQATNRKWLMGILATLIAMVLTTLWQFAVNGGFSAATKAIQ